MCDGLGRQFSYSCPNTTLFQQRMLICDHWYMVNCSKSTSDYDKNLLIGQRDKPFVDDDVDSQRTPRPDLISHEYQRDETTLSLNTVSNLIGGYRDDNSVNPDAAPEVYFLPSHWSTELSTAARTTTEIPKERKKDQKSESRNRNVDIRKPSRLFEPPFEPRSAPNIIERLQSKVLTQTALTLQSLKREQSSRETTTELSTTTEISDGFTFSSKISKEFPPPIAVAFNLPPNQYENPYRPSLDLEPPKTETPVETSTNPQGLYQIPSKDLLPPKNTTKPEIVIKPPSRIIEEPALTGIRKNFSIPTFSLPLEGNLSDTKFEANHLSSYQVNPTGEVNESNKEDWLNYLSAHKDSLNSDCPNCDPNLLIPGTCQPCILVKR